MILNISAETGLQIDILNDCPALQQSISSKLKFGRYSSYADGRVMLVDWTPAYLETTAVVSIANTGAATLTNTAVAPVITFPADNTASAPGTTFKAKALELFLISAPAATGESRDGECVVTLTKAGLATLATAKLKVSAADEVAHMHWSGQGTDAWTTLTITGIKQHGIRIFAILLGET